MKTAIYARYSSDNQRDASIADQLRICREFAARQGWTVVQQFTDHSISGATLLRSGFQALISAPPLRVVNVSTAVFELGIEDHRIEGQAVRIYSLARTVADCFGSGTRSVSTWPSKRLRKRGAASASSSMNSIELRKSFGYSG
jgi:hypothetical protein